MDSFKLYWNCEGWIHIHVKEWRHTNKFDPLSCWDWILISFFFKCHLFIGFEDFSSSRVWDHCPKMMETSGYGLLQYLQKLSDKEFQRFKELLRKEPEKFKLKPIPWTKIENTSKEDLVMQLNTHYPGKAWDIVLSLFLQVNREDLSTMVQKERRGKWISGERGHMRKVRQAGDSFLKWLHLTSSFPSFSPPSLLPDIHCSSIYLQKRPVLPRTLTKHS